MLFEPLIVRPGCRKVDGEKVRPSKQLSRLVKGETESGVEALQLWGAVELSVHPAVAPRAVLGKSAKHEPTPMTAPAIRRIDRNAGQFCDGPCGNLSHAWIESFDKMNRRPGQQHSQQAGISSILDNQDTRKLALSVCQNPFVKLSH